MIVELRQYTLHPGQRDVLIRLFDREFVEPQEALGVKILGQFRDLDDPDRFVWLRGFSDMPARAEALAGFYGGPVWKAHRQEANATMIDSDNVLLLRPSTVGSGFPATTAVRAAVEHTTPPDSFVLAAIHYRDQPFDEEFTDFFDRAVRPVLTDAGARILACLQTEYAQNTFPALPVRTGENVFIWFARFASRIKPDDRVFSALSAVLTGEPQYLRLAPTARSLLR